METQFVGNPEDRFSHGEAHIILNFDLKSSEFS